MINKAQAAAALAALRARSRHYKVGDDAFKAGRRWQPDENDPSNKTLFYKPDHAKNKSSSSRRSKPTSSLEHNAL